MCVMSMVGEHYADKWDRVRQWPVLTPGSTPVYPDKNGYYPNQTVVTPNVTRLEFEKLKEQVAEMIALLKRAKIYDENNHEPNCENDDKMAFLRQVAKLVGVDLDAQLK